MFYLNSRAYTLSTMYNRCRYYISIGKRVSYNKRVSFNDYEEYFMKHILSLVLMLLNGVTIVSNSAPVNGVSKVKTTPESNVILSADFENDSPLKGWSGVAMLDTGYKSVHSMRIESKPGGHGTALDFILPIDKLRGCLVIVSAMVRAENVSKPPQSWNGIKLMMPITTPGSTVYPQGKVGVGTFDWMRVSCAVRVPMDATSASLHLGLEEVTGTVWFDNVRVVVARRAAAITRKKNAGPLFKGHNLPRLRGTMISPNITPESLRTLGKEWNANVLRWQLIRSNTSGSDNYEKWLDGELTKLDKALPLCRRYGLLVVVDLHSPPGGAASAGGYMAADADMFSDKTCQTRFVEVWQRIARRYKGVKGIWGFDLANEPIETSLTEGLDDWPGLAQRAALAIHKIDKTRTLIVEAAYGANPDGFSVLAPIDIPNVVYSVHMYLPHTFTHQGVFGPSKPFSYPGDIDGKIWDRAQLEKALEPVIAFQKRYGVHIYVGEFSAIRWAPDDSAYRYLKDLLDIFEQHGWDWTYHAFREWDGWSVEHGSDRADTTPSKIPTTREKLLRSWYIKNRK